MSRAAAFFAALAAALVIAPTALAATFLVNDAGPANDATALTACTGGTAGCTLPAAIQASNATAGVPDTINFSTDAGPFATPLPPITDPATIDGAGTTTVRFAQAASGALLPVQAANTLLRAITFSGGGSGTMLQLGGQADRLDTVTVRDSGAGGVVVDGDGVRLDAPQLAATGGPGVQVNASNATVNSPDISGAAGDGIVLSGGGDSVTGGQIHDNSGNGVATFGQNDTVNRVAFYGNGGKPIADAAGANGGIAPPRNLRIGPRRADGSLPLTGTGSTGTVELWSGNPSGSTAPALLDTFSISGNFTYKFANEPAPGSVFALSVTGGGAGTSEFAPVAVASDVSSPVATFSRAVDTHNVRVDFSEPLDPASVQKEDFKLAMAGADRPIAAATVSPDGRFVTLASSGWKAGEAGYVDLAGPGAFNDTSGNTTQGPQRLRVAAAPGDFVAPLGARLALTPKTICLTRGRSCRKPGLTIKFVTSEPGKATLVVMRSDVIVGKRVYGNVVAGRNTLKFNGRLGARKLRAGRYRLLIYVQDAVGNITDQPPITLFSVRRVTG